MRKKSPEVVSNQFLDLDSDWTDVLAPGAGSSRFSGKGRLRGHFDGASRGNPGEAGAGAILVDDQGVPVWECAQPLGKRTNNEAEYLALLLLLEEVERLGLSADIRGDSRLVVNQVTGRWKINEPRLRELADRAMELLRRTKSSISWVPRDQNAAADRLSNIALDGPEEPARPFRERAAFDQEKLERVAGSIFIAHGTEDYAVDLLHNACTCPAFQRSRQCKHLDAARLRFGK
ncbi:ribonuclease HI family protein [Aminivibrio sp.]|jgi:ribonuclease HI|uniref:ribonuclease HI family protein n=1 Tax=Aminivibrio sp. TaxID=1872489 RepID=UPI001A4855E5|nr:ribonuclease HI family protein [Aminivibrio sp.]MBL3540663.1 ribonuclease HI family protein [Aminivibrio sp.]MDK2959671.1 ribonuclease [Synergistaceae bacterium]